MNIKELKLKELPELQALVAASRRQLDDLVFKAHQGQLKSVRDLRRVKTDIAQLLTVISGKKQ